MELQAKLMFPLLFGLLFESVKRFYILKGIPEAQVGSKCNSFSDAAWNIIPIVFQSGLKYAVNRTILKINAPSMGKLGNEFGDYTKELWQVRAKWKMLYFLFNAARRKSLKK